MPKPSATEGPTSTAAPDWKRMRLWQIQPIRDGMIIAGVIGILYLGYRLSIVTVPLLLALLLAYLFEPLVARMTRGKIFSRPGAALTIIFLSAAMIIVPVVVGGGFAAVQGAKYAQDVAVNVNTLVQSVERPEDKELRAQLPKTWRRIAEWVTKQNEIYKQNVQRRREREQAAETGATSTHPDAGSGVESTPPSVPSAGAAGDRPEPGRPEPVPGADQIAAASKPPAESMLAKVLEPEQFSIAQLIVPAYEWLRANSARIGSQALQAGTNAVSIVARWVTLTWLAVFGLFLTAFFFYFFCTSYGKVLAFWRSLIPERRKHRVLDLLGQMDRVIAGFVRGRITICLVMMIVYTVGYLVIGVPAWLILGPVVGLLTLVPYVSGAVGVPVAMLLLALEPSGGTVRSAWWWVIFAPIIVTVIAQFLDDYVLSPKIQGKTTNMDTPTILFASLAGGVLAGVYGLLIAIPVAACVKILLREVFWPRFRQWAQGRARDFLPIEHDV